MDEIITRFKRLCAIKMGLKSIERSCDIEKFTRQDIKYKAMSLLKVTQKLINESKAEMSLNSEEVHELSFKGDILGDG